MEDKEIKPLPESPTVEKTLREEVHEIHNKVFPANEKGKKTKELKINRLKVSKSKAKKDWVGILRVNENSEISIEKVQIKDSTTKLKDDNYHAVSYQDILRYKGKPVYIQVSTQLNPWSPTQKTYWEVDGKTVEAPINQVYGQKNVMARMLTDEIKGKKKGMGGILVIGGVLLGIYLIAHFLLKVI